MSGKLTRDDVEDILTILDKSSFDEFRIETDDFKIHLRKSGATGFAEAPAAPVATEIPTPSLFAAPKKPDAALPPGVVEVTAPMLGIYYRSAKPGGDPFVEVGSKVEADSIIGLIEVMKLMNTVQAGVAGEVVEIFGVNGKFVEYGQPILRVRKA